MCNVLGMEIKNWRIEGDFHSEFTYLGEGVIRSVLDYVIENQDEYGGIVESMKILERSESDHLPVSFVVETNKHDEERSEERVKSIPEEESMRWEDTRNEDFQEMLMKLEGRIDVEEDDIEKSWNTLVETIWEAARKSGMVRSQRREGCRRKIPNELREQRKIVWKHFKRFLRFKNEKEKEDWKNEKKEAE